MVRTGFPGLWSCRDAPARGQDRICTNPVFPGCSGFGPICSFREEGVPGTRIFGGRTRWKALAGLMFVLPSIKAISFAGPPSSLRFTVFPKARHSLTRTGPSTGSLFPKILSFPAPLPPETSVLIWNREQGEWQSATRQNGFGALCVTTNNSLFAWKPGPDAIHATAVGIVFGSVEVTEPFFFR